MNDLSNRSFFADDEPKNQEIVFGNGSRKRVADFANALGSKVLLVTDPGLSEVGHPDEICKILEKAGLEVTLFDRSIENPSESSVEKCAQVANDGKIDLIVGLGGGSSMDTAKGCNFILTNGGRMSDYWGIDKAEKPLLPFIAIPTTAGTGSECQSFALISHEESHKKMACGDRKALPKVTILDPELTLSQPPAVSACTGIDALSHAIESLVTTKRNKFSNRHAKIGFKLINSSLPDIFKVPNNLDSRGRVLLGAAHAGAAIENSMLGAAHSIANPLTATKGVIHGVAVGMALPKVMKFNSVQPETNYIYAELAYECGIAELSNTQQQATQLLIDRVTRIIEHAEIPHCLKEFGFNQQDIFSLAKDASEQWTARFNPRSLNLEDFENIYSSLFENIACENNGFASI